MGFDTHKISASLLLLACPFLWTLEMKCPTSHWRVTSVTFLPVVSIIFEPVRIINLRNISLLGTVTFWDAIDGKWGLLVTFRTCFDAVATTDLGILAKMMPEFDARQITVLSIGCDTGFTLFRRTYNLACKIIFDFYSSNKLQKMDKRYRRDTDSKT